MGPILVWILAWGRLHLQAQSLCWQSSFPCKCETGPQILPGHELKATLTQGFTQGHHTGSSYDCFFKAWKRTWHSKTPVYSDSLKATSWHLCHIMCHNWHLIMFTMFNGLEVSHRSFLPSRGEDHTGITGGCATELQSGKWELESCHTASLQPRHLPFPAAIVATWNCSVSWVSSYEDWKYFWPYPQGPAHSFLWSSLLSFLYFLQCKPEFSIRSSWFEPQSAPGLVFSDCIELLHLQLQRI